VHEGVSCPPGVKTDPVVPGGFQGGIERLGERANSFRILNRDRDCKFTRLVGRRVLPDYIDVDRTQPRTPRANCYAERFIGTVRRERTDHTLIYNEQHARAILDGFARHVNTDRPHRSLDQNPPRHDLNVVIPLDRRYANVESFMA
jgi:putative transposase